MRVTLVALVLLAVAVLQVEAAWPNARWRRPKYHEEHGDIRGTFNQYHRESLKRFAPVADPSPEPETPPKRMSRQYHFKFGPIYPEHHLHLQDTEHFEPAKHKRWNP